MPYIQEFGTEYEISIVAYALMLAKAPKAEQAFNNLFKRAKTIGKFFQIIVFLLLFK